MTEQGGDHRPPLTLRETSHRKTCKSLGGLVDWRSKVDGQQQARALEHINAACALLGNLMLALQGDTRLSERKKGLYNLSLSKACVELNSSYELIDAVVVRADDGTSVWEEPHPAVTNEGEDLYDMENKYGGMENEVEGPVKDSDRERRGGLHPRVLRHEASGRLTSIVQFDTEADKLKAQARRREAQRAAEFRRAKNRRTWRKRRR